MKGVVGENAQLSWVLSPASKGLQKKDLGPQPFARHLYKVAEERRLYM